MITRAPFIFAGGGSLSGQALIDAMTNDPAATRAALAAIGRAVFITAFDQATEALLSAGTRVQIAAGVPGKTISPFMFTVFYTTTVNGAATNPSSYVTEWNDTTASITAPSRSTNQGVGTFSTQQYGTTPASFATAKIGQAMFIRGQAGPGVGALVRSGIFILDCNLF